jgi:serine/threonine protein kinase
LNDASQTIQDCQVVEEFEKVGSGRYLLGSKHVLFPDDTPSDEFIFVRFLGCGSSQIIFLVLDVKRKAVVAVKIQKCDQTELVKNFVRVVNLTSLMKDDYVVRILGYKILHYDADDLVATVMTVEQAGKYDMDDHYEKIKNNEEFQFQINDGKHTLNQTAKAIVAAHKQPIMDLLQILHRFNQEKINDRDIKPESKLIGRLGRLLFFDFTLGYGDIH